jgi:hypothetical protein
MKTRVGVAVAHDAVRAVAVRGGAAIWAAEAPRGQEEVLAATVGALLAEAPISRWRRPAVSVAIGPHASQVKVLTDLPPIAEPGMLAGLVRESASKFFLKNGVPLITTGARRVGDNGVTVAGAIDRPDVEAVRDACRARGWPLRHIAPTAVALPLALEDARFTWSDGRIVLEILREAEGLVSTRSRAARAVSEASALPSPTAVPGLAALGADALRYADAYGAALLGDDEALLVDLRASGLLNAREILRPFVLPIAIALLAAGALLLSPLGAVWAGKRAEARVAEVRPGRWQVISSALSQLDRVTAILSDAAAFANSRTSATAFLGDLARTLPAGSMLVSLEFTGEGGQVTALTTDPGIVISTVRKLPSVTSAELAGPVVQETSGGRTLQRVTVRFRRSAAPR